MTPLLVRYVDTPISMNRQWITTVARPTLFVRAVGSSLGMTIHLGRMVNFVESGLRRERFGSAKILRHLTDGMRLSNCSRQD